MKSQKPHLEAEKIKNPSYGSHILALVRPAVLALRLGAACAGTTLAMEAGREITESNVAQAQAQVLTPEQEARRLFEEGAVAFGREDFLTARNDFLRVEEIASEEHLAVQTEIISWNIAICDINLSRFDLPSSADSDDTARATNSSNQARLEEVLGFTTIEQIRPVRDSLIDARTRTAALVAYYQSEVRARRGDFASDLARSREAVAFLETIIPRIEERYLVLEAAAAADIDDGHDDEGDDHIVVFEGREYIETREDIWFTTPRAVTLATGIAGLAASGVGLAGYLLNTADGEANLARCRELQSGMLPCPLSLEREFQANSDRATAFGTTGWIGAVMFAGSAVLFLALPGETHVTREPRESDDDETLSLDITVMPMISETYAGFNIDGRF